MAFWQTGVKAFKARANANAGSATLKSSAAEAGQREAQRQKARLSLKDFKAQKAMELSELRKKAAGR